MNGHSLYIKNLVVFRESWKIQWNSNALIQFCIMGLFKKMTTSLTCQRRFFKLKISYSFHLKKMVFEWLALYRIGKLNPYPFYIVFFSIRSDIRKNIASFFLFVCHSLNWKFNPTCFHPFEIKISSNRKDSWHPM